MSPRDAAEVGAMGRANERSKPRVKRKSTLREYAEAILVAVALTLVIRTFVIQAFRIPTGSMEDTLLVGDFLFVNKFLYGAPIPFTDARTPAIRQPRHGDILVFKYPKDPSRDFIKRVVGLPGDTIEIKDKTVYVNGVAQREPYVKFSSSRIQPKEYQNPVIYPPGAGNRDNYGPYVVPQGDYFMMGDNRDNSDDSRFWGPLDGHLIKGKALFIYWSWNKEKMRPRLSRLGRIIH
ncbi:MAG TPA: signal peptidase I [Dongiaceae bacterium]|jgi:signal peptidase I|nr:signal peptidase I [Dongiaceae bacterium]